MLDGRSIGESSSRIFKPLPFFLQVTRSGAFVFCQGYHQTIEPLQTAKGRKPAMLLASLVHSLLPGHGRFTLLATSVLFLLVDAVPALSAAKPFGGSALDEG